MTEPTSANEPVAAPSLKLSLLTEVSSYGRPPVEVLAVQAGPVQAQQCQLMHDETLCKVLRATLSEASNKHLPVDNVKLSYFIEGVKVYEEVWGWGQAQTRADRAILLSRDQSMVMLLGREMHTPVLVLLPTAKE